MRMSGSDLASAVQLRELILGQRLGREEVEHARVRLLARAPAAPAGCSRGSCRTRSGVTTTRCSPLADALDRRGLVRVELLDPARLAGPRRCADRARTGKGANTAGLASKWRTAVMQRPGLERRQELVEELPDLHGLILCLVSSSCQRRRSRVGQIGPLIFRFLPPPRLDLPDRLAVEPWLERGRDGVPAPAGPALARPVAPSRADRGHPLADPEQGPRRRVRRARGALVPGIRRAARPAALASARSRCLSSPRASTRSTRPSRPRAGPASRTSSSTPRARARRSCCSSPAWATRWRG